MANKDMFLYWGSGSGPCVRVIAVLAEKGLWEGCPNKLIEFSKKEHKTEDVMKINPRGQVPTFKDGDVVVNESIATCLYLEDFHTYNGDDVNKNNSLIPAQPAAEKAEVYQRMFETKNIDSLVMEPIVYYKFRTPKENWDQDLLKGRYETAALELKKWDGYVTGKKYLVGGRFSMADIFLFSSLAFFERSGLVLDKFPGLKQYYDFLKERPSLQASSPPHWKGTPNNDMLAEVVPN